MPCGDHDWLFCRSPAVTCGTCINCGYQRMRLVHDLCRVCLADDGGRTVATELAAQAQREVEQEVARQMAVSGFGFPKRA